MIPGIYRPQIFNFYNNMIEIFNFGNKKNHFVNSLFPYFLLSGIPKSKTSLAVLSWLIWGETDFFQIFTCFRPKLPFWARSRLLENRRLATLKSQNKQITFSKLILNFHFKNRLRELLSLSLYCKLWTWRRKKITWLVSERKNILKFRSNFLV